jgi:3-phenylpropionate/cinnamic acid dioxygenase small subunit
MAFSIEDRLTIHELLALHGHLSDAGAFERMHEVFAADVIYDLSDVGLGTLRGLDALRDTALANPEPDPVGHHTTNVVLTPIDDDVVDGQSKGIGLRADGTSFSLIYQDVVSRGPEGWRIVQRKVVPRRKPLRADDR